jgi:hypothetical protein
VGRSDDALWPDFIARHSPPQPFEELLDLKTQRVVDIIRRERPLFKGLPELVAKLAGRYTLALASGSERAVVEEVLRLNSLGRFFAAVVSGSDVEHRKPAPDIFLRSGTSEAGAARMLRDRGFQARRRGGPRGRDAGNCHHQHVPRGRTNPCHPHSGNLRGNRAVAWSPGGVA